MKIIQSLGYYLASLGILGAVAGISYATLDLLIQDNELSPQKACVRNLKQMDSAKEQYAIDHKLTPGGIIPSGALWAKGGSIKSKPECPEGGTYSLGTVAVGAKCSHPEHRL